jgi:hypothetical protein
MKNTFKYLSYILIVSIIQLYACSNNNSRNKGSNNKQDVTTQKGNCSEAKQYALKTYVSVNGSGLNYTIVGCNENSDGSFEITLQKTGTYDSNGNLEKRYVRVGFDGNNYY